MQRGSVLPLVLISVLAISLAGVLYFLKPWGSNSSKPSLPIVKPSPSPYKQEITDDLLGLKFEIPQKFSLKKETEEEYFKRAFGNTRKNFSSYVLYPPAKFTEAFYIVPVSENNLDNALLTVWVFQNPDNLDANAFYAKYWYYPFVWGDFTGRKNQIAPESVELIVGKEGSYGVVDYREGKPKFIYLPLRDKSLMLQIHLKSEGNLIGQEILQSFRFE